jgi:hypothetical protein
MFQIPTTIHFPFLCWHLSVFFALANNKVVKIARSSSEVVS